MATDQSHVPDSADSNEIDKKVNDFITSFNDWNQSVEKDNSKVDEFIKNIKDMIDEIKAHQKQTGNYPTTSEHLTNLLTISLMLHSQKTNAVR
ncbi:Uncharacterized protein QTN25_005582 [Entamoeba marina]